MAHIDPSAALIAANQRLLSIRAQQQKMRDVAAPDSNSPVVDHPIVVNTAVPSPREIAVLSEATTLATSSCHQEAASGVDGAASPTWELANAQAELAQRRDADGVQGHSRSNSGDWLANLMAAAPVPAVAHEEAADTVSGSQMDQQSAESPITIKAYPTLLTAFLQNDMAPQGRVYMLLKHLTDDGPGWLMLDDLKGHLTAANSPLRICTERHLRRILAAGEGVMWERRNGRIWVYSPDRVANNINCGRMMGKPIQLPLETLLGGMQAVKAWFFASFHAGRKHANPISREALAEITGVSKSSQYVYDQVAGVESHSQIAIGDKYNEEAFREAAWERGRSVFKLTDYLGKHGRKHGRYVAWKLPNSYTVQLEPAPCGRQRKINAQIDPVNYEERGNDLPVERSYYHDGGAAAKAYNRACGERDIYWHGHNGLLPTAGTTSKLVGTSCWYALEAQEA